MIFGVVFINAIIGYFQESKAEHAIEALSRLVLTETTVRREGQRRRIPSEQLVPGDVVLIHSGDRVPADLRLTSVRSLQIDESALTGESVPVHKHCNPLALETVLADRRNLAFAGTLATFGQGEGVVWATGDKTETGPDCVADLRSGEPRDAAHAQDRRIQPGSCSGSSSASRP